MSEIHIKSLSPVNRKKTFKDINKHLSIDNYSSEKVKKRIFYLERII